MSRWFWLQVWNFSEWFYSTFGFDFFKPVKFIYPKFDVFMFDKMMGQKGVEVKK